MFYPLLNLFANIVQQSRDAYVHDEENQVLTRTRLTNGD